MTDAPDGFRRFALDVYGSDGVGPAAVLLQDRCGVDVNVLLLASYVGAAMGSCLTRDDVAAAVALTREWQRDVVAPLRAVRIRLKDGPTPAPNAASAALRHRVKTAELDAEMIELDLLADLTSGLGGSAAPGAADARAAAAMRVVLSGGALHPDEDVAITVIASAAAKFSRK